MGRYDNTVKIPIIVRAGRLEFFYTEKMPTLREGSIGELVLAADAVTEARWLEVLQARGRQELFPAGEELWIQLDIRTEIHGSQDGRVGFDNAKKTSDHWFDRHLAPTRFPRGDVWTPITLKSPLLLELRGEKKARLIGGNCFIPALDALNETAEAVSLNQACTWLSQTFETWRQSHTGNAFERVHFAYTNKQMLLNGQPQTVLAPLETRRDQEMAHHENERLQRNGKKIDKSETDLKLFP